jgi:hypothetical protein
MDNEEYTYKPAKVIQILDNGKMLTVRFTDSEDEDKEINVPAVTTFVITKRYYESFIKRPYEHE